MSEAISPPPLSLEQLAEVEEGAGFCRYGCDADIFAKAMVGEIRTLRARVAELEDRAAGAVGKQSFAQMEADEMRQRSRTSNDLARQLADKTDELATLQQKFNDQAELCGEHSVELAATQIRLEDADAAVKRIGDVAADLAEKAKAFRAERDEARWTACYYRNAWRAQDELAELSLGLLPDWVTDDGADNAPQPAAAPDRAEGNET